MRGYCWARAGGERLAVAELAIGSCDCAGARRRKTRAKGHPPTRRGHCSHSRSQESCPVRERRGEGGRQIELTASPNPSRLGGRFSSFSVVFFGATAESGSCGARLVMVGEWDEEGEREREAGRRREKRAGIHPGLRVGEGARRELPRRACRGFEGADRAGRDVGESGNKLRAWHAHPLNQHQLKPATSKMSSTDGPASSSDSTYTPPSQLNGALQQAQGAVYQASGSLSCCRRHCSRASTC